MLTEDEIKELKFEDGLKKLEELVNQLDDGSLSLEESISYYEIGVKLKSHCEKLLKTAELKILKVSDKEKIVNGLSEDMKKWYKVENEKVWLPSFITLPLGMVFPFANEDAWTTTSVTAAPTGSSYFGHQKG